MSKVKPAVHQILLVLCLLLPLVGCSSDVDHLFDTFRYTHEGQVVTFHFFTAPSLTVLWRFSAHRNDNGSFRRDKENKYRTSKDLTGTRHTLVITNLELDDAGRYDCVDSEGNEQHIDLVVTERQLKCESNIDKKHLEDEQLVPDQDHRDIIKMKCTVIYNGGTHPNMEWSLVRDGSVLDGLPLKKYGMISLYAFETHFVLTYEITLPAAKWLDRSSLRCQLIGANQKRLKHNSFLSKISWLSENIAIKCADSEDCYIDNQTC